MLTKKKKLTRKEIKEDPLIKSVSKVKSFYEENQTKIFIALGVVAAIVFIVFIYLGGVKENNMKAATELGKIMNLYDQGNYQDAIEGIPGTDLIGLKKIVDEYGSTENGEVAKIYLANSYTFIGEVDKALEYYLDYSGSNPLFEATAMAGAAGCYENKNEFKKAADLFLEAANLSEGNPLNSEYLFYAAINYIEVKENEKANELLEKIKKDYPNSYYLSQVNKYLTIVN
ncbi:MAG: tetratricopeptide repeat protein [Ignavibacteriales bacterium]|nr:tetratricopeptide repeat protein [Ignavibacteriales bacterium]